MEVALWIAGGVVAVLVILDLVGRTLPRGHVATSAVVLRASPADVWAVVADIASWSSWNPQVKSVQRFDDRDGKPVWSVGAGQRAMTSVVECAEAPRRLVTRIADEGLPFGGSWTWDLGPAPLPDGAAGTRVAITEDGFIRPPFFRPLARFAFGYHATQVAYLRALAARFGDAAPVVERVR